MRKARESTHNRKKENRIAPKARCYTRQGLLEGVGRYSFAGQFAKGKAILEVGCENGYGASYLMSKGASKVIGGDISQDAILYAKAHYQKDGLHFLQLDAQQLPFINKSFDVIIAFEVIEHLTKYEDFLRECQTLLKDDGFFICSTPNKAMVSPNSNHLWYYQHVKEFYPDEFHALLANYFKDVAILGFMPTSRTGARIKKLIYRPKPKIFYLIFSPVIMRFRLFITRFVPTSPQFVKLEELKETDLDRILDKRHQPYPFQDNPSCFALIAVARK